MILLDKYQWGTPTERMLQKLNHVGLHVAPGAIGDGLQKIAHLGMRKQPMYPLWQH